MEEDAQQALQFGAATKVRRKAAGLSLDALAERSGVSRAMLSKVERGEKCPSLPVASRIARGLGVGLSVLLGADPLPRTVAVVRREQRLTFRDPESGFLRELLSPGLEGNGVEIARHEIPGGRSSGDLPAYPPGTCKSVYVERGTLTLRLGGVVETLRPGDAATFAANTAHRFDCADEAGCAYILVVSRRT